MTNVLLLVWDTFINFVAVCLSFLLGTPKSHLGLHPSSWKIESLWLLLYNPLLPWELFFLLFSCLWAPHHCLNWFRLHSHLSLVWCVWLSLILIQIVLWFFFFFPGARVKVSALYCFLLKLLRLPVETCCHPYLSIVLRVFPLITMPVAGPWLDQAYSLLPL